MAKIITVLNPKILERGQDLVLIPHQEYKALVRIKTKGIPEVKLTHRQRSAIAKSEREFRGAAYFTLNELKKYLAHSRAETGK